MNFSLFDDWIEIFRGGQQIDSAGRAHDGDNLIDQAVANFNTKVHEPPVVIGHPADNAPAYGWVEGLRKTVRDGAAVLEAKLRQVVPEFADLVRRGLFKKRSAAFYPDGGLRHVGFLGAAPPAVKGLADIGFMADDGSAVFEFTELSQGGPEMDAKFTEADLEKAKQEAAQAAVAKAEEALKAKMEAEFAERETRKAREARITEIKRQLDDRVKAGKIPPVFMEMGLADFVASLEPVATFTFSDGKKTGNQVEFLFSVLDKMDGLGLFREIATKERAGQFFTEAQADEKVGLAIADKVNPKKK